MDNYYKIEKLDHQGRGIIRDKDTIIFVENALPEEVVQIEIDQEKKRIKEAHVSFYQNQSKDRIEPSCPYYLKCGGCNIMHMSYADQLKWKETKVKEIMNKFLNSYIQFPIRPIIGSTSFNYRNKAIFQVDTNMGYFERRSNQIVPLTNCNLVDFKINDLYSKIAKLSLDGCFKIMIRASKNIEQSMVVFYTNKNLNHKEIIECLKNDVTSIYIINKKAECIYGTPKIQEKIGDFTFYISPDSFFQVNTDQAKKLYDLVLKYASLTDTDNVLDLYCGTGTIGLYLSHYCKKVFGIEINKDAILDARENQKLNHVSNIDFVCSDVAKFVDKIDDSYSVIVVDPPRSGLDSKTVSYLKKWKAKRIVYVSCDPVTLARDLNLLKEVYEVKEITPVDMFPQTYHVECVAVLVHKNAGK